MVVIGLRVVAFASLLVRIPRVAGAAGDANASTTPEELGALTTAAAFDADASSTPAELDCPVSQGTQAPNTFTPVFFDMECLGGLETIPCAADAADDFVSYFAADLRVEASALIIAQLFCMICLLQTGGIPVPRDFWGAVMFAAWSALQLMQFLFAILSLLMLPIAIVGSSSTATIGECSVLFLDWISLKNLVAFVTWWFHPAASGLAGAVLLSMDAVLQGLKVLAYSVGGDSIWTKGLRYGLLWMNLVCIVMIPLLVALVLFVLSGSFAFGIPIFLPIALFLTACLALTILAMVGLSKFAAFLMPGKVNAMLWWVGKLGDLKFDVDQTIPWAARITFLLVASSPMVFWGTWLALYVYNGASTEEVGDMIDGIYSWVFDVFTNGEIILPKFTLDPSLVGEAIEALADMANLERIPPVRLLQGCQVLSSLSALLAILKLPVVAVSLFRDYWGNVVGTVPYSASAAAEDHEAMRMAIEEGECPKAEIPGVDLPSPQN